MSRRLSHYRKTSPSDMDLLSSVQDGVKGNTNVKLYAPFTGVNNATTAKDYSSANRTLTFNGNAKISTTQSYYNGGSAVYFDGGAGCSVEMPQSTDLDLLNLDFTIKFKIWFDPTSSGWNAIIGKTDNAGGLDSWILEYSGTAWYMLLKAPGDVTCGPFAWTLDTGRWHEAMVVRKGSNLFMYMDGLQLGAPYNIGTVTITAVSKKTYLGRQGGASDYFKGYLQDVMVITNETWNTHKFYDTILDAKSSYLKAGWKFGDYSIYDAVGAHTLTNNSSVTFATVGVQGYKCATFSGSNYLQADDSDDFNIGTTGFISFWMNTSSTAFCKLMGNGAANTKYIGKLDPPAKALYFQFAAEANNATTPTDTVLCDGLWHHIVLMKNGLTCSMYADGVKGVDQEDQSGDMDFNNMLIGKGTNGYNFTGSLQEIIVGKGVLLTQTEIDLLYNSGKAKLLQLERREHKQYFANDYLDSYSKFLVANWKLNEMSGTRYDSAGLNKLTDTGGVTYTADATFGNVATFNGSTQCLAITHATWDINAILSTRNFSISFWMKASSPPAVLAGLFCCNGSSYNSIFIKLNSSGYLQSYVENNAHASKEANYDVNVCDSVWHHCVYTCDSATSTYTVYVDGVSRGSSTTVDTIYDGTHDCLIGAYNPPSPNYYFTGSMQKFLIYSTALDTTAISHLYNQGLGAKTSSRRMIDTSANGLVFPFESIRNNIPKDINT